MKHVRLFITLYITLNACVTYAQEYAVDKKATWLSGAVGFSSLGGDVYKKTYTFVFTPSFNYFLSKNFFTGLSTEFAYQWQWEDVNSIIFGVGPQLGLAAGNINSRLFPFFSFGFRFHYEASDDGHSEQKIRGTDSVLGAGMVTSLAPHLGLSVEAAYHFLSLSDGENHYPYSTSTQHGNNFTIGIGITGLFYNGETKK